jgi:hypothetical protein
VAGGGITRAMTEALPAGAFAIEIDCTD